LSFINARFLFLFSPVEVLFVSCNSFLQAGLTCSLYSFMPDGVSIGVAPIFALFLLSERNYLPSPVPFLPLFAGGFVLPPPVVFPKVMNDRRRPAVSRHVSRPIFPLRLSSFPYSPMFPCYAPILFRGKSGRALSSVRPAAGLLCFSPDRFFYFPDIHPFFPNYLSLPQRFPPNELPIDPIRCYIAYLLG